MQRQMVKSKQGSLATLLGVVSTPAVWSVRLEVTEMNPKCWTSLKTPSGHVFGLDHIGIWSH